VIGVWIRLTKGYVSLIDREDEALAAFTWTACYRKSKNGKVRVYAVHEWECRREFLHQAVFGPTSEDVDHKNGDTLDNTRLNLRAATRSLNNANATKRIGTTSRFKGVSLHAGGKWLVQICHQGKRKHIGLFRDEVDAATAYNFAAEEEFGEFARFNTP